MTARICFLAPLKYFFQLFMFSYSVLLFLSGRFFDSLCFSLWRDRGGNGWTQQLYYIAGLFLPYYSIDKHCQNKKS